MNINDLHLRDIFLRCNMYHSGMRNGPFQGPKSTISHPDMGFIASQNGQYQNAEHIFSDYVIGYIKDRYAMKWPSICLI